MRGGKTTATTTTQAARRKPKPEPEPKLDTPTRIADEHSSFWRGLQDHEFFGDKLQHIYFYSDVTDISVLGLRDKVLAACRSSQDTGGVWVSPKPILIHVHSHGGSMSAQSWLMSLFNQVHVPLCVMVDALSASAATALSVMSPFRVATQHSLSLLHDYTGGMYGKREELIARHSDTERHRELYKQLYLARSKITDAQLEALLRRDMWLDAATCLKYGIYDRVLHPNQDAVVRRYMASSKMARMPAGAPFVKTNWNNVFTRCSSDFPESIDAILANNNGAKPIVYITPSGSCDDHMLSLAMIARIKSSQVPVFGVIDNIVSWWQVLPVLYCHRRYMYENAVVDSGMVYSYDWGVRVPDIVHNAGVMRGLISSAIGERARPSPKFLADLFDRQQFITAAQCLDMGIVDEVVSLVARRTPV